MFTSRVRDLARGLALLSAGALMTVSAGCGQTPLGQGEPTPELRAGDQLYISIGDSYAAGYQPQSLTMGSTSKNGFAYQIVAKAAMDDEVFRLVNFGCAGVTTSQLVGENGCQAAALGPGAPSYPNQPQAAAALAAMRVDPSAVALVTIVVGGNDVAPCLQSAQPQQCVEDALPVVRRNLTALVTEIRRVVGPNARIVGLTYPDAYLGEYVHGTDAAIRIATLSRLLFSNYLNPVLKEVYTANGASFIDITTLTGAFGPLDRTTTLAPYGKLPVPVANVCRYTFYCEYSDVHPTTAGYSFIADQVLKIVGA